MTPCMQTSTAPTSQACWARSATWSSDDDAVASVSSGETDLIQTQRQEFVRQARDLGDSVKRYENIGNNCGGSIFNTVVNPRMRGV